MELAAVKAQFDGVRKQPLFAIELEEELDSLDLPHLLPLSDILGQAQLSPPSSAPVPRLQGSHSTLSRDHEPKAEESKCAHCGKVFKTNKAKYGHMRIHGGRSGLKLKGTLESTADFNINRCGSIKRKRVWKQMTEKNTPEAVAAAFILMEMSRSKSNGSYMESNIPLDLDKKKHMHMHASENCNTISFPSHQALVEHCSSHKKNGEVQKSPNRKRKRKRKVKSESGSHPQSHVCEVCNKSYPTGHQLGGHMRAHPKKDPTPINEVPNGGEAALHVRLSHFYLADI